MWIFILQLFLLFPASCKSRQDNLVKITRKNDRVITFEYLDVNVTAIKSKKGILIIDTHRSPSTMKKIRRLIEEEFGRKDYLYIINTHGDYDHCSGNQIFPDAIIIGQENCPGYIHHFPANTSQAINYFRQDIAEMKKTLKRGDADIQNLNELPDKIEAYNQMLKSLENEYKVTPPVKTFKDSLTLNFDDLTIKMFYCGKAHSDNDILIYIPEEKLVFTGDLFNSKYSFGFGINKSNDVERVIATMNHIMQYKSGVKYVIPGHWNHISGDDFAGLRDLLQEKTIVFQSFDNQD